MFDTDLSISFASQQSGLKTGWALNVFLPYYKTAANDSRGASPTERTRLNLPKTS